MFKDERDLAVRTLIGEAGNQGDEGLAAVANVIKNRVNDDRYGGTIYDVITQPKQFSVWNNGDRAGNYARAIPETHPIYQKAAQIFDGVLSGEVPDITNGATHYANTKTVMQQRGSLQPWLANMVNSGETTQIGAHTFGKADAGAKQKVQNNYGLPEGFKLDDAPQGNEYGLPAGFTLDEPTPQQTPTPNARPNSAEDVKYYDKEDKIYNKMNELDSTNGVYGIDEKTAKAGNVVDRNTLAGLTFNLGDEAMAGLAAAKDSVLGRSKFSDSYDIGVEARRRLLERDMEQDPANAIGSQIVGGVAPLLLSGGASAPASGAGLGARLVQGAKVAGVTGAAYGFGAGEGGIGNRLEDAAISGVTSATLGAALPVVGAGAKYVGGKVGDAIGAVTNRVTSPIRGLLNSDKEAERRILAAEARDALRPSERTLTQEAIDNLQNTGAQITRADQGGETTRTLARAAANASPEARDALQGITAPRFADQSTRLSGFIEDLTGVSNNFEKMKALKETAAQLNTKNYNRAYAEAENLAMKAETNPFWSDELQRLTQSPDVQDAIKGAIRTGANISAKEGVNKVTSPFVVNEAGQLVPKQGVTPNLRFWDEVKRNLDDKYNNLNRAGNSNAARDVLGIKNTILDSLDNAVPSYKAARQGAAQAFGAEDATEAGAKMFGMRSKNPEIFSSFNKFNEAEKQMAKAGYVDAMVKRIQEASDGRNLVNTIYSSPAERERITFMFGAEGAKKLEAQLHAENMLQVLNKNVQSGSDTVKNLIANQMLNGNTAAIGAGTGVGAYTGDWKMGVLTAGLMSGKRKIDSRVAQKIGEKLASTDPKAAVEIANMAAKNPIVLQALRDSSAFINRQIGQRAAANSDRVGSQFLPAFANQDDVENPPPR